MFAGNPQEHPRSCSPSLLACSTVLVRLKLHRALDKGLLSFSPPMLMHVPYGVVLPDPPLAWLWCVAVGGLVRCGRRFGLVPLWCGGGCWV